MKVTITTIIFLNLYLFSLGQITFQKVIDADKWNSGFKIINTYDNKYLQACNVSNTQNDLLLLIKSDKYGNIEWRKYYGKNYRITPVGEIQEIQNHGFILTGRAKERNTNNEWKIYVLKIDEFGNTIWEKTIDIPNYAESHSVIQSADNNFLITGSMYSSEENKYNTFLAKLDTNGDTIWVNTFFKDYSNSAGQKIMEKSSNEYYLLSTLDTTGISSNSKRISVMKVDSLGNRMWSTTYQDSVLGLKAIDMIFTPDENIVILGQVGYSSTLINPSLKVIITNLHGVEINSFESKEINYDCLGIHPAQIQFQNGKYYIIGSTNHYDNTKMDGFIYVFNENGTIDNYKYFGGRDTEHFNSFCKADDKGFAITGRTYSFGSRENYGDIYFVKTDNKLESTINTVSKNQIDTAICQGDSIELFDNFFWDNKSYFDTINMNNYDSVIVIDLSYYPQPFFNLPNDTSITQNDSIILKPLNINSYTSITWNDSISQDSLSVFGNNSSTGAHEFWCSVTNDYGCTFNDTIVITVTIPNKITPIELADIQIYPNPFYNYITIQNKQQQRKIDIRIVDIYGRIQYYANDIYLLNKYTISLEQLKGGIYFLEINDKAKKTMEKFKIIK